jgi:hypothetical protein
VPQKHRAVQEHTLFSHIQFEVSSASALLSADLAGRRDIVPLTQGSGASASGKVSRHVKVMCKLINTMLIPISRESPITKRITTCGGHTRRWMNMLQSLFVSAVAALPNNARATADLTLHESIWYIWFVYIDEVPPMRTSSTAQRVHKAQGVHRPTQGRDWCAAAVKRHTLRAVQRMQQQSVFPVAHL